MSATSFFGGAFFGGEFFNTPAPGSLTPQQGGGDSTRLRRKGRRPKYFWQQAIEDEQRDKLAEAAFDAVADAYLIDGHKEFAEQVNYIRNVEQRVAKAGFDQIAEQLVTALKDLEYRAEMRLLLSKAQEESEIRELMEIL